jgi:hypothetical protein
MKRQTVIEQLRETRLGGAEYDIEKTTATPSRLTCRWEQDARGKLACFWTLQPKEEASMYHALGTRGMLRPR